jgi:hypothetical protein
MTASAPVAGYSLVLAAAGGALHRWRLGDRAASFEAGPWSAMIADWSRRYAMAAASNTPP